MRELPWPFMHSDSRSLRFGGLINATNGSAVAVADAFHRSRSFSYFLIYLALSLLFAFLLAGAYHVTAIGAFERQKTEEKEALLKLANVFVSTYTEVRTADMPIPATFTKQTVHRFASERTAEQQTSLIWVGLPKREITTAPLDQAMTSAMTALSDNPREGPVARMIVVNGKRIFRSIYPSLATHEACIECHNKVQERKIAEGQPPWRLGDMMGAFVLDVSMDDFLDARQRDAFLLGSATFLVCLGLGLVFFWQNARRVTIETENRIFVRIAEAIEDIADGLAIFDPRGRMLLANKAYRRQNGGEGLAFSDPLLKTSWEKRTPQGNWIKVDETRTASGISVCLETDITALKERETELLSAMVAAEAAGKARSNFLAMMSHELRTPLNAIIGFSEVMRDELYGPLDIRYREYASDINLSGRHLLEIIGDILDLSKIDAGRMEIQIEDVDVDDAVLDCVRLVKEQACAKGIAIAVNAADRTFAVDGLRFRQIVLNLLTNAVKFTPRGGRVAIEVADGEGGELCLTVADTGIGISKEDIPRVLQPFVQVGNILVRHSGGTGLGLPLCKALVELHHGSFHIESGVGEGTTVTIRLPQLQGGNRLGLSNQDRAHPDAA